MSLHSNQCEFSVEEHVWNHSSYRDTELVGKSVREMFIDEYEDGPFDF